MKFTQTISGTTYEFDGIVELMAKATPLRSGDQLAGCAATSDAERASAAWQLADGPLATFLEELVVPYETDEVTRLILDTHDREAFAPLTALTVGGLRDLLLVTITQPGAAAALAAIGSMRAATAACVADSIRRWGRRLNRMGTPGVGCRCDGIQCLSNASISD